MRCGIEGKGRPQELQKGICMLGESTQEKNTFFITHQNIYQDDNLYLQMRKKYENIYAVFLLLSNNKNIHIEQFAKIESSPFESIS